MRLVANFALLSAALFAAGCACDQCGKNDCCGTAPACCGAGYYDGGYHGAPPAPAQPVPEAPMEPMEEAPAPPQ